MRMTVNPVLRQCLRLAAIVTVLLPARLFAAAAPAEAIVFVADSRRHSGWLAMLTNLYNENLFLFALLTVVTIPPVGLILGTFTSFLLSRVGINLRTRTVAEH